MVWEKCVDSRLLWLSRLLHEARNLGLAQWNGASKRRVTGTVECVGRFQGWQRDFHCPDMLVDTC